MLVFAAQAAKGRSFLVFFFVLGRARFMVAIDRRALMR